MQVTGIDGVTDGLMARSVMKFGMTSARSHGGKSWESLWGNKMIVLPMITTQIAVCPVVFNSKWKHLQGLHLADPQFGILVQLTFS